MLDAAAAKLGDKAQDDSAIGQCRPSLRRSTSTSASAPVSPKVAAAPPTPARCRRRELPEVAAGWPLLKKDIMAGSPECSEMSVVEWAMRLPSRCSRLSPASSSGRSSDLLRRRDSAELSPAMEEPEEEIPEELALIREKYKSVYTLFSYSDLAKITSDFSPGTYIHRIELNDDGEFDNDDDPLNESICVVQIVSSGKAARAGCTAAGARTARSWP